MNSKYLNCYQYKGGCFFLIHIFKFEKIENSLTCNGKFKDFVLQTDDYLYKFITETFLMLPAFIGVKHL